MGLKYRYNISNRLIVGFGSISIVVLICFVLIFNATTKSTTITERNINIIGPSVQQVENLNDLVSTSKMLIKSWVLIERQTDTPDKIRLKELHSKDYPKLKMQLDSLSVHWPSILRQEYDTLCDVISNTLFKQHETIMESLNSMESYEDPMVFFDINTMVLEEGEVILTTDEIVKRIAIISGGLGSEFSKANKEMRDSFEGLNMFLIVAILVVFLFAIISSIFTIRGITRPIERLKQNLENKSDGIFRLEELVHNNDEIGDMAVAVRNMTRNILNTINKIKSESITLTSSSTQISKSAEAISTGANMQATSTEEVSASIEEMAASITQNAENAQNAGKTTKVLGENIEVINKSINDTTSAMNNIADKVKVISEIAKKVDMLAINASIEAARAGQAGKGFGVVASEVRKLAENTSKAAYIIDEVSQESVSIAMESQKLIEAILPEIKQTVVKVQEISSASIEQSSGIKQVKNAIQQLGHVTQQNAASAEQLFGSSTELMRQSEELKKSITFFKTEDRDIEKFRSNDGAVIETKEMKSAPSDSSGDKKESSGVSIDLKGNSSDTDFKSF